MKRLVTEQRLGFVATVSPDGTPNVSPKGTTAVWDDEHLVFAHIRSPRTVANVRANPAVEVNVVDPVSRLGYRFKGSAEVHEAGPVYERGLAFYGRGPEWAEAIVLVRVARAARLVSPAYDDGSTEEEVRSRWEAYYAALRERGRAPEG